MTAYATTMGGFTTQPDVSPLGTYPGVYVASHTYPPLLTYGTAIAAPADPQIVPMPAVSNYRLAFSTSIYRIPTEGQLWPRGDLDGV